MARFDQQDNAAYDLRVFENRNIPLRVVENKNIKKLNQKRRQKRLHYMSCIFVVAAFLGLIASVLVSNNAVTQLSADIYDAQQVLEEAQAENDYLTDRLSSTHNLSEIENYAEQMGLAKINRNEVYFTLETENQIERNESEVQTIWDELSSEFMNFMEYLVP